MATKKGDGGSKSGGGEKNHRSAVTGQYVKEGYAKSHPKTTVSESRPKPSPPITKKKT